MEEMITVCIATYNGEKYIREQLLSILPQLGEQDEVVVSDDGSTDATVSIVESLGDSRIVIVSNKGHHGVNNNFNNAISHAKGDVVFFADQDDVWLPGKVKRCLDAIKECDCVMHDCIITDRNLREISPSLYRNLKSGAGFLRNFIRNSYSGGCMCIRKELMTKALPIPDTEAFFFDQWLGLCAELTARTRFIDDRLMLFRRHERSLSTSASPSRLPVSKKIYNRFILIRHLLPFFIRTNIRWRKKSHKDR